MTSVINYNTFYNTIYDEDLHDYINGNIIINMKMLNNSASDNNIMTKNIIIDYYLNLYKIESTKDIYNVYSEMYDKIILENKCNIKKNTKIIPYYKTKEFQDDMKEYEENKEYEEDKIMHYNAYFGRYNDLLHIIDYYKKIREEEENKINNYEQEKEFDEYSDYESDYDYNEDQYINDYDEDIYSDEEY